MNFPVVLAGLLALCVLNASSFGATVELTNGDRLSGRVLSKTDQQVVIEHPVLGKVTLPAANIAKIHAQRPTDAPDVDEPQIAADQKVATAAKNNEANVKTKIVGQVVRKPPMPADVQSEDVDDAIKKQNESHLFKSLLEDWDSKLELGLNGSGGDADTQNIYVRLSTQNQHGRDRWLARGQYFLGRSRGQTSRNQADVKLTRDWLQKNSPWFLFGRGEYKFDEFRSWKHRVSGYGGGGYVIVDNNKWKVVARAGLGGTYEFGQVGEWTPEAFFSGSSARWNLTKRQSLAAEFTYYPSLESLEDYRLQGKIWWQYKLDLLEGLSLKVGADDEYDATPDRRDDKHDLKYYGAVVLEF